MARSQEPNGSFFNRWHAAMIIFNRWHAANYPTGHFSTDGTLQCSFSTDGTLPSTRRVISQPMACCQAPVG
jgi:hypothetical protein